MKTFGEILREKRKDKEWSQQELADKLGVRKGSIGNWENDKNVPDIFTCTDLADIFDCSLDELVGREMKSSYTEAKKF